MNKTIIQLFTIRIQIDMTIAATLFNRVYQNNASIDRRKVHLFNKGMSIRAKKQ